MLSYLSSFIWRQDKNQEFHRKIVERLNKEAINADALMTQLEATNSIIAGSLPLQIYLNKTWSNDLDIFTSDKEMLTYFEKFYKRYLLPTENTNDMIQQSVEYKTPTEFRIRVIYSTEFSPKILPTPQMSDFEEEDSEKHAPEFFSEDVRAVCQKVFNTFDFDFCKIAYDGRALHIDNITSIKTRSCMFDFAHKNVTLETYDRMLKYEQWGFRLANRDAFMDYMIRKATPDKDFMKKLTNILSLTDSKLTD